jgi:hypothetical protein
MKTKFKILILLCIGIFTILLLTGCVPGDGANTSEHLAGFFMGIWHGWIAPISLIGSIFNDNIGIYEIYNKGFWYDLGYYMAIISGFGGLALSRRKSKDK